MKRLCSVIKMVAIVDLCGNDSNENPGLISNFLLNKDTVSPAGIARRIAVLRRQSTLVRRELTEEEEKTMKFLDESLSLS